MRIKRWTGSAWVDELPTVGVDNIETSGTPSSTTFLNGDGAWAVPQGSSDADTVDSLHASSFIRSDANDDFSGTLNYTPDTGTILSVDGQAVIQRMTANGALTIGHDDAVIIAGGDTSGVLNSNINNATETVFVGAEGGFVAYAFPSNNTAWSNRKEMNWNGTNLTLLGNNVATQSWVNSQGFLTSETGDIQGVTAGDGLTGGGTSGTPTLSHADTSSQASVNNSGNTFIQDITLDTYGHITAITSATASTTDSTKLPLAGGTMTGDLTLDHDGESTANDSHGVVFTARFNSTDFTRELFMDDEANLKFGTDTIFHSGNDGATSGLHADLLDSQQGSYYLDYNNFTNTPTIPTNNNQLTNGAGYVTANTQLSNEQVQDIVGAMVSSNSESGISVTYQDGDGTLDFNVNDPTITLTGDVTGSATMTNLGNVSITATVANDSHTHDGRYYTETETNSLLAGKLSTTAAAAAITYVTSCPTSNNSTGMKVYVGSTDCSTKYSGWLYLIT